MRKLKCAVWSWMLGVTMALSLTNLADAQHQTLTIAAVQYPMDGKKTVEEILSKVEVFVDEAAEKKADLVVLPELITLDVWPALATTEETIETERQVVEEIASNITARYFEGVRQLAGKHRLSILAGSSPMEDPESKQIFNVALLVLAGGEEFMQKKIQLTKWEKEVGIASGSDVRIANTPWGKTAILICYDVEFPDISAGLMNDSPCVMLVPSMTESQAGLKRVRWTAQARAIEHHAIVVVSGTVGHPLPSWKLWGQAAILGPATETFEFQDQEGTANTPGLILQTIDLTAFSESRKQTHFHPAKQRLRD